ncbi:glycosyltransferase [Kitasatospora sp. NPDC056273]|uniref:glycosyltransferase n=1 Tax=Kitasatospora sp. NPDC056273 TaxID=3345769 RepID=UPI0035DEF238
MVVVSSRWEARSLVVQEAMRAGVPVVATAVGGETPTGGGGARPGGPPAPRGRRAPRGPAPGGGPEARATVRQRRRTVTLRPGAERISASVKRSVTHCLRA